MEISDRLSIQLKELFKDAKEVYIAVALMKNTGFEFIESNTQNAAQKHFLIGIDLPTEPIVLRTLLWSSINYPNTYRPKIYKQAVTYHPKVYIAKNANNTLKAIVGSANATAGGLDNNIEMNTLIDQPEHCSNLLKWFNKLFAKGEIYNEQFIDNYQVAFRRNQILEATKKSNLEGILSKGVSKKEKKLKLNPSQFFRQSDFDAFVENRHTDKSNQAKFLRSKVRERFLELDEYIFDRFADFGIDNLFHPKNRTNYTSQYFHSSASSPVKDALWLHYGKHFSELRLPNKSFIDNIRIQVILRNSSAESYIGVWLFVGRKGGSSEDRKYLKTLIEDKSRLTTLHALIQNLGFAYEIWIGNEEKKGFQVSEIQTQEDLYDILSKDSLSTEFIIGRDYDPNSADLQEENIEETILIEISRVYKVYDFIRFKE